MSKISKDVFNHYHRINTFETYIFSFRLHTEAFLSVTSSLDSVRDDRER